MEIKKTAKVGDEDGMLQFEWKKASWLGCCVISMPTHNYIKYIMPVTIKNTDDIITFCTMDRDQMIELKLVIEEFLEDTFKKVEDNRFDH